MAKETATITFTLEDEFSAQFQEIVGKLEQFQRQLAETAKRGTEGFRETAEHVKKIGDHSAGANASLRSMSTYMKEAFGEFNRTIAGSVHGLTQFESRLTSIGPALRGFVGTSNRVATILGGVAAGAATAAGSLYLLGRRLAQSYAEAELLERRLGSTGAAIENMRRLAARGGYGEEQAIRTLERIREHAYETRRGVEASLDKALRYGISGVGPQLADEANKILEKVRDQKISPEEGYELILKNIYGVQTSDEVKRVIAKALGLTKEQMDVDFENIHKRIRAIDWSADMKKALGKLNDTIHKGMEEISNEWTKAWNAMGPKAIEEMDAAIAKMQDAIKAAMPTIVEEVRKGIKDLSTIPDSINEIITAWNKLKQTFSVDIWPHLPEWIQNPPPLLRRLLGLDTGAAEEKAKKEGRSTTEGSIARQIADMFEANRDPTKPWTRDIVPSSGGGDTPYVPARRMTEEEIKLRDLGLRRLREQQQQQQQGTPQRFGAYGGADLSQIRIREAGFDAMLNDPENIRLGKLRTEDRRFGIPNIGDALKAGGGAATPGQVGQGGQPIVLTQMAEAQREMADDIKECRDVLTWLRDQILADYPIAVHEVGEEAFKRSRGGQGGGGGDTGAAKPGEGAPGLRIPGSPSEAPESLDAARRGGFMPGENVGALKDVRQRFAQELQDPATRNMLLGLTRGEVGSQGPQAQQAFMESVLNRAAARGQTLRQAMTSGYYPAATRGGAAGAPGGAARQNYENLLTQVLGGSNVSNYATGNASGSVGFAGGPLTFAAGGERYGIEGPDRAWAEKMRQAAQSGGGSGANAPWTVGGIQKALGGGPAPAMGQGDQQHPPSNLLEAAKKVAAMGGGPAVYQFMAQHGYPKAGNWCGEFAAAVVRSAGGTPPRNPEVASNWRNFGQQVAAPQPGDIAVRRGVRTGSTGSHVTIVGSVGQGRFQGIGGNQRAGMISQFSTASYEFFRPGGGMAGGKPLDAAAMAGAGGGGMAMPGGGGAGAGGGGGLLGALGGGGGGWGGGGGGGVTGQATITINVTVPAGAQVSQSAQGSGILANPTVNVNRAGQMSSAGQNARAQPNYYGNEY